MKEHHEDIALFNLFVVFVLQSCLRDGVEKIFPLVRWDFEYLEVIETRLAFKEDRIRRLARERRLA